ncbi:hypothetical protein BpHYR1_025493, partial [Brachionus plicatilis]
MAKKFRRNYLCLNYTDLIPRKSQHLFTLNPALRSQSLKEPMDFLKVEESQKISESCQSFTQYAHVNESEKNNKVSQSPLVQPTEEVILEPKSLHNEYIDQKLRICLSIYKLYIKIKMTKTLINEVLKLIGILRSDIKIPACIDKIVLYLSRNEN